MSSIDWIILIVTLLCIVLYGTWKTRKNKNLEGYLKGNNTENWATIGLSIMATQASAITFLSTPGQAYEDGMGFIQIYFGLPIAMILISVFFLPIYYKLKVYTAYQYLEQRFDVKVRALTALLFLMSRGLAAGITIFAPAIIVSSLMNWNLELTCIAIGALVIIYTVSGGSRAVSLTQKWQMAVIMTGMFVAFYYVLDTLPENIGIAEGTEIAGKLGKMEIVDLSITSSNNYTLFTGLFGGLFLSLSYFGTDQSQVQRYLGGKSLKASRMGLMMNGILKIPMQFFILFIGIMVFISFQFNKPPIIFNESVLTASVENKTLTKLEKMYDIVYEQKREALIAISNGETTDYSQVQELQKTQEKIRHYYKLKLHDLDENYDQTDHDYIFLNFVLNYLPKGLVGLLLAMIFSAAMSSTAGELNALASTTTIDYYKKFWSKEDDEEKDLRVSKLLTVAWGILAIIVALTAGLFENLIELVNILGSLFYGTILGVFLLAFFFKNIGSRATFIGAIIAQLVVLSIHLLVTIKIFEISYLLYNVIGAIVVILCAYLIQYSRKKITNN